MNQNLTLNLLFALNLCVTYTYGQQSNSLKSDETLTEISLTYYNHAARITEGTWKYTLTENSIQIKRRIMFSPKDTVVFTQTLESNPLLELQTKQFDTLSKSYTNWCIMLTSGNEYTLNYSIGESHKRSHFHHYYHQVIANLVIKLNQLLPEKYQMRYLQADTKQDCEI